MLHEYFITHRSEYTDDLQFPSFEANKKSKRNDECSPYTDIESQPHLDLQTTEQLRLRPFKPKYHLTMGMARSDRLREV